MKKIWIVGILFAIAHVLSSCSFFESQKANVTFDPLVAKESYFLEAVEESEKSDFGNDRIIAVLDTGINDDNDELRGTVIAEYDTTTGQTMAEDHDGHGTKMASIIASRNNGKGITGVAFNAKLIDVKVVADDGSISTENIMKGIEFAVEHEANVINMSFSSGEYSKELEDLIDEYSNDGVVFVAAAGNEGENACAYPAGYKQVVAVSSLRKGTDNPAIYANYDDHIHDYVEDGIWTYDGQIYLREYGTSEAAAVVSGYLTEATARQSKSKSSTSQSKGSDPETVFQDESEKEYLTSLANFLAYQDKVRQVFPTIEKLRYFEIDFYTKNVIIDFIRTVNANSEIAHKMKPYILLSDMFSNYAKVAYKNEYALSQNHMSKFEYYINIVTSLNTMFEKLEKEMKPGLKRISISKELNESLLKMISDAEGENDAISKLVRKYGRMLYGDLGNKSITSFKAKNILEYNKEYTEQFVSVEVAGTAVKTFKYLFRGLKVLQDVTSMCTAISDKNSELCFFKIKAIEYLTAVATLDDSYFKKNNSYGMLHKLVNEALENDDKLKELIGSISIISYVKIVSSSLINNDEIQTLVKKKTGLTDVVDAGGPIGKLYAMIIEVVLGEVADEAMNSYMYILYREFINNMYLEKALYPSAEVLGNIKTQDINRNLITSIALNKFVYYSTRYLQAFSVSCFNNDNQTEVNKIRGYKISEEGIKYEIINISLMDYPSIGMKIVISDIVKNNIITTIGRGGKEGLKLYLSEAGILKRDGSVEKFSGVDQFSDFTTILKKHTELTNDLNGYQIALANMLEAKDVYNTVAEDNEKHDDYLKSATDLHKEKLKVDQNKMTNIYIDNPISESYFNIIPKAMCYEDENGIPFVTNQFLKNMEEFKLVTRKDYMIAIIKSAQYIPYADESFITELVKGERPDGSVSNIKNYFADIDTIYDGQSLTFNEKIWLLYGKHKGIFTGVPIGNPEKYYLHPFENVSRADAIALTGLLTFKKTVTIYNNTVFQNKMSELHIIDQDEVMNWPNSDTVKNIGIAILNEIAGGKPVSDGSIYKKMDLNAKLTYYETGVIAFNLYSKVYNKKSNINPVIGQEQDDHLDPKTADPLLPQIDPSTGYFNVILTRGVPTVVSGKEIDLRLQTSIREADADKILIKWEPVLGELYNFQKTIDSNGKVQSVVKFKAPVVQSSMLVPVTVYASNFYGKCVKKDYYVSVLPYQNYSDPVTNPNETSLPASQISASYTKETNTFKISWQGNDKVEQVEIESSYDQSSWQHVQSFAIQSSSIQKTIADSKKNQVIYFRIRSLNLAENTSALSLPFKLAYQPLVDTYTELSSEKPMTPSLYALGDTINKNSVTLRWQRVNDSHNNDNVSFYEVMVADNSGFTNETVYNAGNNAAGANIYESCSYTVDDLLDDHKYYFKVRAYNQYNGGSYSSWSGYQSIRLDLQDLPYFETTYQSPVNGSAGVDKSPLLKWRAYDKDGDDLEYYVSMGENPSALNSLRAFNRNEGQNWLDFASESHSPLKPNTTYYWQVSVREDGRDKAFYGGEYIKSPVWSFTTSSEGSDLAIINAELIGTIKPDADVIYKLTIKNLGTETASSENIQGYYKKNGITTPFLHGGASLSTEVLPGETAFVNIKLKFRDEIIQPNEYNGNKIYDNVLIAGDSTIIIDMPYLSSKDTNPANNTFEIPVHYENQGLPVFTQFFVGDYSVYFHQQSWFLYPVIGEQLSINFDAIDDLQITKAIVEYRLNENDTWHHLATYGNSDDSIGTSYYWNIPEDKSFVTTSAQVRVLVYEDDINYSERISEAFPIHSNDINFEIIGLDKSIYTVGEDLVLYYSDSSDNPLSVISVRLVSNGQKEKLKELIGGANCGAANDSSCLELDGIIPLTLPDRNLYANDSAYLEVEVSDRFHTKITITSKTFTINPKIESMGPFDVITRLFNNPQLPVDAQYANQYSGVKFVRMGEDHIVHAIVEYTEDYFLDTQSGDLSDDYFEKTETYYMTYDESTQLLSSKIKIPNGVVSMELDTNNIPYILMADGRQMSYSYRNGGSFVTPVNLENPIIPSASAVLSSTTTLSDIANKENCIIVGSDLYDLDGFTSQIRKYTFSNGTVSNVQVVNLTGDISSTIKSRSKPVINGNVIYTLDYSILNVLNISSMTRKTISLPFTLTGDEFNNDNIALQFSNNVLCFFARGEVYHLENDVFVKKSDILYSYDGETVNLKPVWNQDERLITVAGSGIIYLVFDMYSNNQQPRYSRYEILEYNPTTSLFSKKIIVSSNQSLSPSFKFGSSVDDWTIVDTNKILLLGSSYLNTSTIQYAWTGLSVLDLETGDILYLGDINIPSRNAKFITSGSSLYLGAEELGYTNKIYSIQLSNIDKKPTYFDLPTIKKYGDKLIVNYRYGETFNGQDSTQVVSGTHLSVNDVNRAQTLIEIFPSLSGKYDLADQYISSYFNYSDNYVAFPNKAVWYHSNDNGSIGELALQLGSEYQTDTEETVQSYSALYESAFVKNDAIYLLLADNLNTLAIPFISKAYDSPGISIYDDYLLCLHENVDSVLELVKYSFEAETDHKIRLNIDIDRNERINLFDTNSQGMVGLGWNDGSPYLSVADLSKDIQSPLVKIDNSEKVIERDQTLTLNWSASDNQNQLEKYEIYQNIQGVETLLSTITNTETRSYTYTLGHSASGEYVNLKVVAYDLNGNSGYDVIKLDIVDKVTFNSFDINESNINLGENLIFTWGADGSTSSTRYTLFKQKSGETEWTYVTSTVGENSKTIFINDFVGEYTFKIVSGNYERVSDNTITINGELLKYYEKSFKPDGKYFGGNVATLQWDDTLIGQTVPYNVFVKKEGEAEFIHIGNTVNKFYEYTTDGKPFEWKISARFNDTNIESNEHSVTPMILGIPQNVLAFFTINEQPQVTVSFGPVEYADSYIVAREFNGHYDEIATITDTTFEDLTVLYGESYSYSVYAINGDVRSERSESYVMVASYDDAYSVTIENTNYQILASNNLSLTYLPNSTVQYEMFEVLLGTSPDNMYVYNVTTSRLTELENLLYGTTYYVEIYPVDYLGSRLGTVPAKLTFSTGFDTRVISELPVVSYEEFTSDHITITWTPVADSDNYLIFRKENGGDYEYLARSNGTMFTDAINLSDGTTYQYMVKAANGFTSSYSNETNGVKFGAVSAVYIDDTGVKPDAGSDDIWVHVFEVPADAAYIQVIEITDPESVLYGLVIEIPEGTLTSDTTIQIREVVDRPDYGSDIDLLGVVVEFSPVDTVLGEAITVKMPFTSEDLLNAGLSDAQNVQSFIYNNGLSRWEQIAPLGVDDDNSLLIFETDQLGVYSLGVLVDDPDIDDPVVPDSGDGGGGGGGGCFITVSAQ